MKEIKDLKNAILQEKSRYELLLDDRNKLERDIKNLLDKRISQTMIRKNSSETDLKSTKQEKIILESLALRVEDLEVFSIVSFNFYYKNFVAKILRGKKWF